MTADATALARTLTAIDSRGYGAYKELHGRYDLGPCRLVVDHVQADPYAPPSLMRLIVDRAEAALPEDLLDDRRGRVATTDFLARAVAAAAARHGEGILTGAPGQEVLERTSVAVTAEGIEARLAVPLPASGRRVRGRQAARLLTEALPRIAESSLRAATLDVEALRRHVTLHRDQEALRDRLAGRGLVAFVGDGAILPRRAGDSDLPLVGGAVPFTSPASLRVRFELPSGRSVQGMGVPDGVTVIVGGGYHGKSTLLRALARGVHPHVEGDGREWVIARADAAALRAEDGRSVAGVDISPFLAGLPSGADTRAFSTTNASGSTSQAASLVEAVDAGASAVLLDEDTSATNMMFRDERMRALVSVEREPITPFVDRVRPLLHERGVSTVLVAGGSAAFLDVADCVIAMDEYVPHDVTARARELAGAAPKATAGGVFGPSRPRRPAPGVLRPAGKRRPAAAKGRATIRFGQESIDLAAQSQLVDAAQTQAVAHALDRLAELLDAPGTGAAEDLGTAIAALCARLDAEGLEALSPHRGHPGHLARPRALEIHAAVNRYRGLRLA
ncbi:ABC-ATPase domain-containing protein [Brachybacterium saurashtrense]|uniref:ATPase n=1 Tax=Brachybacterium saurashtrense TaxID=556288 RepID=A0A345YMY9_9MICO|nr:ABC-ATPase domain-containing protein [Brachybacterium saurashtrense]AXK45291.1 ATPase [Brachybacterium saurashtrense]RRR21953.1 ATPase [Brachybacterium saurashtrense]